MFIDTTPRVWDYPIPYAKTAWLRTLGGPTPVP